jgi:hypothetical protein
MHPIGDISLVPLIKEVTDDPIYSKAAITLARVVQMRIDQGGVTKSNFYEDGLSVFRTLKVDEKLLADHTFKLFAIYATNGPNTPYYISRFITDKTQNLYYGIGVISTGITVLNSRSMTTGHPYAYPAQVHSTCDNGKPYHFWMAAYLARRVAIETGDSEAGKIAAYLSEVGYQMRSLAGGRQPDRPFMAKTFDPGNNKIRMDLAWGGAGVNFGVSTLSKSKKGFDVDAALKKMLGAAVVMEPLAWDKVSSLWSGTGYEGYDRWTDLFQPKVGFDSFE